MSLFGRTEIAALPPIRCAIRCACLIAALLGTAGASHAEQVETEQAYRVKAAFIYNFTQFIDWPANAFAGADSPFSVCVLAGDPIGEYLLPMQKRSASGHPIVISYPKTIAEARDCRILYLESAHGTPLGRDAARALRNVPVLTVSSHPEAMAAGVGVGFVMQSGKVRWTLNLDAVRQAQLKVSAKLVEIAVAVVGEGARQ